MTAPRPTLVNVDGTTRIRLHCARMTPQQARAYALAILEAADDADWGNDVRPVAAPFVPATLDGPDRPGGDWDEPLPDGAR